MASFHEFYLAVELNHRKKSKDSDEKPSLTQSFGCELDVVNVIKVEKTANDSCTQEYNTVFIETPSFLEISGEIQNNYESEIIPNAPTKSTPSPASTNNKENHKVKMKRTRITPKKTKAAKKIPVSKGVRRRQREKMDRIVDEIR